MANKDIIITGILAILLISLAYEVSGTAIGASPATLSFKIPRGGYEEKTFQVSTNSEIPLEFEISVSDSIKNAIKVETKDKATVYGQPAEIIVRAYASRSAKPESLDGAITATVAANADSNAPGGSGSVVSTAVAVKIKIEITDETTSLFKDKTFLITLGLIVTSIVLGSLYFIRTKGKLKKSRK